MMKQVDVLHMSDCCGEYAPASMVEVGICPKCKDHCEFTKETYEWETNAEHYGTDNCYRPNELYLTDEEYEDFG